MFLVPPTQQPPSVRESQPRENDLHGMARPESGLVTRPSLKLGSNGGTRMGNILWAGKLPALPLKQIRVGGDGGSQQGLPCCK